MSGAGYITAVIGAGHVIGMLIRSVGDLADWRRERRTDRLAR